jgi:hypothetical protein
VKQVFSGSGRAAGEIVASTGARLSHSHEKDWVCPTAAIISGPIDRHGRAIRREVVIVI